MSKAPAETTYCTHENIKSWDCGCSWGPPSCSSCHIMGTCLDCGRQVTSTMLAHVANARAKAKARASATPQPKTGPVCQECGATFGSKPDLRAHRASTHGWTNGGRAAPWRNVRLP